MARTLTRSKSLRFLRGRHKEQEYEENVRAPTPSQTEFDRYFTASPILIAGSNLDALDIAVRPRTSEGPADRPTMFHLKSVNPTLSVHPQDTVFDFPPTGKSPALLYSAEVTAASGVIGIALGSPTMGSHWNTSPQISTSRSNAGGNISQLDLRYPARSPACRDGYQESPRPKLSRWKSLFKKQPPPPPPPSEKPGLYQVVTTVTAAARADCHDDRESLRSQTSTQREDGFTRTKSPPLYRLDIRESRKIGAGDSNASQRGRAATLGASTTTLPSLGMSSSSGTASGSSSTGRFLDVAIPDIKMERYSVMFGNVLQTDATQSSSLLARRQGNAEKLKPLHELSSKVSSFVLVLS